MSNAAPGEERPAEPPESYPRRVLLAVAGNTPQVLTETLYALIRRVPAFVPTEVHVLTTREGAHRLCLQLFDEGRFSAFCADQRVEGRIRFDAGQVTVLRDLAGVPLDDIRTPEDNAAAADQTLDWLRRFAADPQAALHVSLAGGRKTMGFYLGSALSLFGRPQDRLSHVLVSEEFEATRDFFWPPERPAIIYTRRVVNAGVDERPVSTAEARVWLAEIPFVRLRDGLPAGLLGGRLGYGEAVQVAQSGLPATQLLIDVAARRIVWGDVAVTLPPKEFAFYLWLAARRRELGDAAWLPRVIDAASGAEFIHFYWQALGQDDASPRYARFCETYRHGLRKDEWANPIHHLRRVLRREFGRLRGDAMGIVSRPVEGVDHEECALALAGGRIAIEGLAAAPDAPAWLHNKRH